MNHARREVSSMYLPTSAANVPQPETSVPARTSKASRQLLLLSIAAAFVVVAIIPAWRRLNSDFPNYYLVAKLYRAGYALDHVYDWTWLQRQKDHQGIDQGVIGFIPLTLPSALVIAPFTSLSPLDAKHCWLVANLLFLFFTGRLLTGMTKLGALNVALLMAGAFVALRNNFVLGQMHVLVLLLLTLALWFQLRQLPFLCGLTLAVAAALKLYPALFLILFVFRREWRASIGLVFGLIAAAATSLCLFGREVCLTYVRVVLPAALRAEVIDPYNVAWGSMTALLRRLLVFEPELNPHPVAHLPSLYAFLQPALHSLVVIVFLWSLAAQGEDRFRRRRDWAIYVFVLLLISSQPAGYHFAVLILPAALIVDEMIAAQKGRWAKAFVVVYVLACSATFHVPSSGADGWLTLAFFPRLWLLVVMAGMLLAWMFAAAGLSLPREIYSPRAASALIVWTLLVAVGFISTRAHLIGEFESYNHRILSTTGSLFASDPAFVSDHLVASVMTSGGYTIREAHRGSTSEIARAGGDWIHPTSSPSADTLYAERVTQHASTVVRWPHPEGTSQWIAEVQDAQQPVVSNDGKYLAFFREQFGRNSLWIHRIGSESSDAKNIVGSEYDPQDATFLPDGTVIFSSATEHRYSLYVANSFGEIQKLNTPTCSARYPAVSPDGRSIAFSCQEAENWNIYVKPLQGTHERQLTTGECNSVAPVWTPDSRRIVYATDCGRGLGLTALADVEVNQ